MAALISWICRVDHGILDRRDYLPSCTLHAGKWAYCLQGGNRDHAWEATEPAPIEMLHVRRHVSEGASMQEAHAK